MKNLILALILVVSSLSVKAVDIVKNGKTTTLTFKNKTEMQKTFSFDKAKKGHVVNSVTSQNGKIVIVLTCKF